jgi:hypothetical protein
VSYAISIEEALTEEVPMAGVEPGDERHVQPHVYTYGKKPDEHRDYNGIGDVEPVPLQLGANVIIRTKDGQKVAEGFIEDVMFETRVVRVRDQGSGGDVQIDVDPDRYTIEVLTTDVLGIGPTPGQETLYMRPSRPGPHKFKSTP